MITDAMDAATQQYISDQAKLRSSIFGDEIYK